MERFAKIYDFNSHAHVERDLPFYVALQLELYFNSHAHVERDVYNLCKLSIYTISTHTLTWSVTFIWRSPALTR